MGIVQITTDCPVFDRLCFRYVVRFFYESMDCNGGISHDGVRIQ